VEVGREPDRVQNEQLGKVCKSGLSLLPLYREFAGLGDGVSRLPDEHAAFGDASYQGVHQKGSMDHCLHPRRVQSARAYKRADSKAKQALKNAG